MARYAVISNGTIENFAVWDGVSQWQKSNSVFIVENRFRARHGQSMIIRSSDYLVNILIDGNSIARGPAGVSGIVNSATSSNYRVSEIVNMSKDGHSTTDLISSAKDKIDSMYDYGLPGKNLLIIWEGSNDIYRGSSSNQSFQNLKSYCLERIRVGWKIIIGTLLPRNTLTATDQELKRLEVNDMIRSDKSFYNDISDVGAHSIIGNLDYCSDRQYYSDGCHLTITGQNIAGQIFLEAINRMGLK